MFERDPNLVHFELPPSMEFRSFQPRDSAELTDDELHVWSVALDGPGDSLSEQWQVLSPDERQRAERYRVENARRRFVAARMALRNVLGRYLRLHPGQVAFDYDERGKPRLRATPGLLDIRFNLAHSGELALIAVTRGCEVGVDVERLRSVTHWREISERYFHANEIDEIAAQVPEAQIAAFLRCWTGKEAVLKAVGIGVTRALDFYVGSAASQGGRWVDLPPGAANEPARCWLAPLAPAEDYVAAVATVAARRRPGCIAFS